MAACVLVGWLSMAAALAAQPTKSLDFIENRGQWNTRARYAANLHQGRLFLENDGLTYALFARNPLAHTHDEHASTAQRPTLAPTAATDQLAAHSLHVRFVGASAQVQLRGEEATGEVRNYLHGTDPAQIQGARASQTGGYAVGKRPVF